MGGRRKNRRRLGLVAAGCLAALYGAPPVSPVSSSGLTRIRLPGVGTRAFCRRMQSKSRRDPCQPFDAAEMPLGPSGPLGHWIW